MLGVVDLHLLLEFLHLRSASAGARAGAEAGVRARPRRLEVLPLGLSKGG